MKLASFTAPDGRSRFGAVVDGGIVDLTARLEAGEIFFAAEAEPRVP